MLPVDGNETEQGERGPQGGKIFPHKSVFIYNPTIFLRVITVSLETMKIVNGLPKLEID